MNDSKKPKAIFLCGSAAVGKTSLTDEFDRLDDPLYLTVGIHTIDIRHALHYPSWDLLKVNPHLAVKHQMAIFAAYVERIVTMVSMCSGRGINLIFDRSPLDVIAYSVAFGLHEHRIGSMEETLTKFHFIESQFLFSAIQHDFDVVLYNMKINATVPYIMVPTRPVEEIRKQVAAYVTSYCARLKASLPFITVIADDYTSADDKSQAIFNL